MVRILGSESLQTHYGSVCTIDYRYCVLGNRLVKDGGTDCHLYICESSSLQQFQEPLVDPDLLHTTGHTQKVCDNVSIR